MVRVLVAMYTYVENGLPVILQIHHYHSIATVFLYYIATKY